VHAWQGTVAVTGATAKRAPLVHSRPPQGSEVVRFARGTHTARGLLVPLAISAQWALLRIAVLVRKRNVFAQLTTTEAERWVARPARRDLWMILVQQLRALTVSACRDTRGCCLPPEFCPVARVRRESTKIRWAMAFALIVQKTHGLVLEQSTSMTAFACPGTSRRHSSARLVPLARSSRSSEMDLLAAAVLKIV